MQPDEEVGFGLLQIEEREQLAQIRRRTGGFSHSKTLEDSRRSERPHTRRRPKSPLDGSNGPLDGWNGPLDGWNGAGMARCSGLPTSER